MTTWVMALVPGDADEATTETASTWAIGRESRVSGGCGTCCPVFFVGLLAVDIVRFRNVFFFSTSAICCATTMNSHDLPREGPSSVS